MNRAGGEWLRWLALIVLFGGAVALVSFVLTIPPAEPSPLVPAAAGDDDSSLLVVIGQAPTSDADGWPAQVGAARGLDVSVLLTGESSYLAAPDCRGAACSTFADQVEQAIALQPDVVVVAGGALTAGVDATTATSAVRSTLAGIRVGLPDATVVVAGPLPDESDQPAGDALDGIIRRVVADLGMTYVSLLSPPVVLLPDAGAPATLDDGATSDVATRVASALP